ncbi:MAG TPA: hypothetical protein VIK74_10960 [Parasegetibacter sp.]
MKFAKFLFLAVFLFLGLTDISAQNRGNNEGGFDASRLFLGGNFGASFGDYTLVNISPQLGYRFSDYFAAGAGVGFQYFSVKTRNAYTGEEINRTNNGVAGLNIFGRVYPVHFLLIQVQPEINYTWGKDKYRDNTPDLKLESKMVPSLLLGGGVALPAGAGSLNLTIMYDVIQDPRSPYSTQPFFNMGYNFGF